MATSHRYSKGALLAGYLALLGAVVAAHRTPATGYELSIYRATPLAFWAGVAVALLAGVAVAFAVDRRSRVHGGALLLLASAMLSVMALPILRGYAFYGAGDSLSHLGWASEIAAGRLSALNLLYPGIHVTSVATARVAGVPLRLALLYVALVVFPVVFTLFVPLLVQFVGDTRRAFALGVFAAVCFLPLNNIALYPVPHPASQAILFFPVVAYLAFAYAVRYARGRADGADAPLRVGAHRLTGIGALLALASSALVLVHPQQALNAALFLAAVAGVQLVARRVRPERALAGQRALALQAGVLAAAFAVWSPRFQRVQGATLATVIDLVRAGPTAGEVVGSKSVSLTAIGGSLPVLFVKLFGVAAVLSLLAGVLLLRGTTGRFDRETNALVRAFGVGLVPLFGVFLVVLAASSGDMYFRYEGFIMALVAVLGAAALARGVRALGGVASRPTATVAVVVLVLACLPVAVMGMHSSPYMYQPSKEVPNSYVTGYSMGFEHRAPGVEWLGLRGGPQRYVDVHYGTEYSLNELDFPGYKYGIVPPGVFRAGNYSDAFDGPKYLSTTSAGYETEVGLYRGYRYPSRGYWRLTTTPGVNRVVAGGGFRLYYVANETQGA